MDSSVSSRWFSCSAVAQVAKCQVAHSFRILPALADSGMSLVWWQPTKESAERASIRFTCSFVSTEPLELEERRFGEHTLRTHAARASSQVWNAPTPASSQHAERRSDGATTRDRGGAVRVRRQSVQSDRGPLSAVRRGSLAARRSGAP